MVGAQLSDGLFDITTGVLRQIWKFNRTNAEQTNLPTVGQIDRYLPLINWQKIRLEQVQDPGQLTLPLSGMEIDFGGRVKEYAVDAAVAIAKKNGLSHGLVDLGGDVAVIGAHPDGQPWKIGIRRPNTSAKSQQVKTSSGNSSMSATILATHGAVASSGDYERFLLINGQKYSHILNPKTGWPVQGFAGVSVWAEQCVVAGTVATIAMLKGIEQGLQWLNSTELPYIAIDQFGKSYRR